MGRTTQERSEYGGEIRIAMHHFVKESRIAAAPGVVFAAGADQARREAT
jgi:hypothetical protein